MEVWMKKISWYVFWKSTRKKFQPLFCSYEYGFFGLPLGSNFLLISSCTEFLPPLCHDSYQYFFILFMFCWNTTFFSSKNVDFIRGISVQLFCATSFVLLFAYTHVCTGMLMRLRFIEFTLIGLIANKSLNSVEWKEHGERATRNFQLRPEVFLSSSITHLIFHTSNWIKRGKKSEWDFSCVCWNATLIEFSSFVHFIKTFR